MMMMMMMRRPISMKIHVVQLRKFDCRFVACLCSRTVLDVGVYCFVWMNQSTFLPRVLSADRLIVTMQFTCAACCSFSRLRGSNHSAYRQPRILVLASTWLAHCRSRRLLARSIAATASPAALALMRTTPDAAPRTSRPISRRCGITGNRSPATSTTH